MDLMRISGVRTSLHHKTPSHSTTVIPKRRRIIDTCLLKKTSRREAAAILPLSSLSALLFPPSPVASAFSIGISGPKEWLKEQKRKSSNFLLAPINASRQLLLSVSSLLTTKKGDEYTSEELEKVRKLLRSAARDCVPRDRNSFVAFQANTGVEVCTFRLILKNAASLLDENDGVKLETEALLRNLIKSFASLNALANDSHIPFASNRDKVANALMDTISSLNKFEQGVKDCLQL